jgi:branched-chain amino acid transport system permease protein
VISTSAQSTSHFWDARAAIRLAVGAIALVCFAVVPWVSGYATQRLLVEILCVMSIAMAWNLLAGYGGLVVVGHHMFVGVGAYALFSISNGFDLNPWMALPLAALVSVLFAALSALPLFRLSGPYFAVATWVLAEVLRIGATNSSWLGAGGGLPLEAIRGFDRATRNAGIYWAALAVFAGSLLTAWAILRGRLGLALMSTRDSEAAAAAAGVSVQRAKFLLWIVAGVMTGLAGSVSYMSTLQVTPDASFGLSWTAIALFITILGGIGTLEGPILGTVLYFILRELFAGYGTWYFIGIGVLAMLTMVLAPGGMWSLVDRGGRFDVFGIRRRANT